MVARKKTKSKATALQKFLPGDEAAEQTSQPQSGISTLGLRGAVL